MAKQVQVNLFGSKIK